MDIERIRAFIEKAKGLKLGEEQKELLQYFEEYVELHNFGTKVGDFKDKEFQHKLVRAHHKFWNAFKRSAGQKGMTLTELKEKLLQAHRFRQDSVPSENRSLKKMKKNKNNLRA